MTRTIGKVLLALAAMLTIQACTKTDTAPYANKIKGVELRDIYAQTIGAFGTPDIWVKDDNFHLLSYPIPAMNVLYARISANNAEAITIEAKLIHALFPGAPLYAKVENKKRNGQTALKQSIQLDAYILDTTNGGINNPDRWQGDGKNLQFDISDLPSGFYRLYITISDGREYWDNIWITR